jgi:hypothetical protein
VGLGACRRRLRPCPTSSRWTSAATARRAHRPYDPDQLADTDRRGRRLRPRSISARRSHGVGEPGGSRRSRVWRSSPPDGGALGPRCAGCARRRRLEHLRSTTGMEPDEWLRAR